MKKLELYVSVVCLEIRINCVRNISTYFLLLLLFLFLEVEYRSFVRREYNLKCDSESYRISKSISKLENAKFKRFEILT